MSSYQDAELMVYGNAERLKKFAIYMETEYPDEYVRDGISDGRTRDGRIDKEFLGENCYKIEGCDNHFNFLEIGAASSAFPELRMDLIMIFEDDAFCSYEVWINGKTLCSIGDDPDDLKRDYELCPICQINMTADNMCFECSDL